MRGVDEEGMRGDQRGGVRGFAGEAIDAERPHRLLQGVGGGDEVERPAVRRIKHDFVIQFAPPVIVLAHRETDLVAARMRIEPVEPIREIGREDGVIGLRNKEERSGLGSDDHA